MIRAIVVALCLSVTLSGCLIGTSSNTRRTGQYVSAEEYHSVRAGDTKARVRAVFGLPSRTESVDDSETWSYEYSEEVTTSGSVLFLFSNSSSTEEHGRVIVEFQDGVVRSVERN